MPRSGIVESINARGYGEKGPLHCWWECNCWNWCSCYGEFPEPQCGGSWNKLKIELPYDSETPISGHVPCGVLDMVQITSPVTVMVDGDVITNRSLWIKYYYWMAPNGQKGWLNEHFLSIESTLFNPPLAGPSPPLGQASLGFPHTGRGKRLHIHLFLCGKPAWRNSLAFLSASSKSFCTHPRSPAFWFSSLPLPN